MENFENKETKKEKFKRVIKSLFVHNYPYKIIAIVAGAVIWLLVTGL